MKQKISSLIVLGIFVFAAESVAPQINNWFAFGANAVEFTEIVEQITDIEAIAPAIYAFIEFLF